MIMSPHYSVSITDCYEKPSSYNKLTRGDTFNQKEFKEKTNRWQIVKLLDIFVIFCLKYLLRFLKLYCASTKLRAESIPEWETNPKFPTKIAIPNQN